MATNLQHVTRALRLIGVLQEGEQPSADAGADALVALQAMLASWEGEGVPLSGLVGQTLTLGATLPLPATHDDAIQTNLALRLAPEYGASAVISPLLVERADTSFRTLQGQYADDIPMSVEPALIRGGRVWWDWSFNG
jgi:hypothetical protein